MRSLRLEVLVAVGLLLGAPTADAAAQQFSVDFPKAPGQPGSCMTDETDSGGHYLRCAIEIPAGVPTDLFIRAVVFSCTPADSAACQATQECGSAGNCVRHPNPVEPVAFNIQNLRSASYRSGWTTTPAEATLHFEVIVGP